MALETTLKGNKCEKTFYALGTINAITAYGSGSEEAVNAAYERIIEIDDRMSAFKENSDVMKINNGAGIEAQEINSDTFEVLKCALKFSKASKGAFDITIRPITSLWGFGMKQNFIPDKDEIKKSLKLVSYQDLILDDKKTTAYLKNKGQAIDLGGIAKGYAADEVRRILMQYKVKDALINLGGNIEAVGCSPSGKPWRIGIQNPLSSRGEYVGIVKASDKTVVTSGCNEQFFVIDGVRYHHIIDPRTGYPVRNELLSVTVVCDCSIYADAVTTALFVQGFSESISLLKSINAEAVFIMKNKDIYVTEGLKDNFERSQNI